MFEEFCIRLKEATKSTDILRIFVNDNVVNIYSRSEHAQYYNLFTKLLSGAREGHPDARIYRTLLIVY
jgi:hypothetical protein